MNLTPQEQEIYFARLSVAGDAFSAVDAALAEAEQAGPVHPSVRLAHAAAARGGPALEELAVMGRTARAKAALAAAAALQLAPGQVVADVGSLDPSAGAWTGSINPLTLTRENWAWWSQHQELWPRASTIFDRPYRMGNPAIGPDHLYTAGDLSTGPFVPGELLGIDPGGPPNTR